jgi:hypothetical protein
MDRAPQESAIVETAERPRSRSAQDRPRASDRMRVTGPIASRVGSALGRTDKVNGFQSGR